MQTKSNQIYEYLKNNCLGYEKRVKANVLMDKFGIADNKTFRSYIQEIRQNEEIEELIGSEAGQNGGYYIISNYYEFRNTVDHYYLRAMEMLKTYGIMKSKYEHSNMERLEV